jgi:hypothetical protein
MRDADEVEAPLQRRGEVVDAPVAAVGGGDDREPGPGEQEVVVVQLGDGHVLLGQDRDEGVLHVAGRPGQLLEASDQALVHGGHDRRGDHGVAGLALGDHHGDVPGVLDVVLGGAGGALDDQGRVTADGGGQQLGEPALAGARVPDQQQAAVRGQRHDAALDEAAVAEPLLGDVAVEAVGPLGAEHEQPHHARAEPPRERPGAVVDGLQPVELVGVLGLGGGAEGLVGHRGSPR